MTSSAWDYTHTLTSINPRSSGTWYRCTVYSVRESDGITATGSANIKSQGRAVMVIEDSCAGGTKCLPPAAATCDTSKQIKLANGKQTSFSPKVSVAHTDFSCTLSALLIFLVYNTNVLHYRYTISMHPLPLASNWTLQYLFPIKEDLSVRKVSGGISRGNSVVRVWDWSKG